ncbi:hypothetical protein DMN77_13510 [Paenibacillus sp. 79R4]|uniref:hypothetical protein n=1 Tax=Paenibacillus sp. 79R4 TaxID=2212847 RepID=UPI0015B92F62|nr:hypothetical protein [Paenibacillus sp. 79R4]NWL88587.1 hypothetical protein [Paenibacillus sp. 79R4]
MVLLANVLKLERSGLHKALPMEAKIAGWARAAAEVLRKLGIINGRDAGQFVPYGTATPGRRCSHAGSGDGAQR